MSDDFNRLGDRQNPRWHPSGPCSLFATDIAASGNPDRTDDVLGWLRKNMYELIEHSFDGAGVPFGRCYWEDRGDGAIIAVPMEFPASVLVSPLLDWFGHELDRYNKVSAETVQMRLRIALHTGEANWDGRGLVGTAVNHVFRLLDAAELRAALSAPDACIAFIASERVHEDVIKHGRGLIRPGDYRPADVRVKETATRGWIRVLTGSARTAGPAEGAEIAARAQPPPATASTTDWAQTLAVMEKGITARQVPTALMFEMVEAFLNVAMVADPGGREQLVLALRKDIAAVIRRYPEARLDMWSILRTCLDFPAGLSELMSVVGMLAGDSLAVRNLQDVVVRLISGLPAQQH
jgi:hypothetical protein